MRLCSSANCEFENNAIGEVGAIGGGQDLGAPNGMVAVVGRQ